MKLKNELNPRLLIRRLVEEADCERLLSDTHDRREPWKRGEYYLPGRKIESLSPEEREAIKSLTPEDCQNLRIDGISWRLKKLG